MIFKKEQLLLYAITDQTADHGKTLYERVEDALRGGATCVQFRDKTMPEDEFIAEAVRLKELCSRYGVPLIVNDKAEIALRAGADGVHVGQDDMPADEVRRMAGPDFIIGVTAKTVEQAQRAARDGADYIGVGAVFPSPTKKNAIRITKEMLKDICSSAEIPAVAIGGVTAENMSELRGAGMSGFAVVSALFAADDIKRRAEVLRAEAAAVTGLDV